MRAGVIVGHETEKVNIVDQVVEVFVNKISGLKKFKKNLKADTAIIWTTNSKNQLSIMNIFQVLREPEAG